MQKRSLCDGNLVGRHAIDVREIHLGLELRQFCLKLAEPSFAALRFTAL